MGASRYMVGLSGTEQGMDIYEFAPNIYVPQSRALLLTKETRFQTKGLFRIFAERLPGKLPIQLKAEAGGFNAEWPVYSEITKAEREEMRKERSDWKTSQQKHKNQLDDAIIALSINGGTTKKLSTKRSNLSALIDVKRKVEIERLSNAISSPEGSLK